MSVNALAEAVREGKELMIGTGALSAGGALAVVTPFATIDGVIAIVNKATAPTTVKVTWAASTHTVTLYGWKRPGATAAALTENSGDSTPDDTIADVSTAVTATDGTTPGAAALKADVDTRLVAIDSNFADLADQINKLTVDDGALVASDAEESVSYLIVGRRR